MPNLSATPSAASVCLETGGLLLRTGPGSYVTHRRTVKLLPSCSCPRSSGGLTSAGGLCTRRVAEALTPCDGLAAISSKHRGTAAIGGPQNGSDLEVFSQGDDGENPRRLSLCLPAFPDPMVARKWGSLMGSLRPRPALHHPQTDSSASLHQGSNERPPHIDFPRCESRHRDAPQGMCIADSG